MAERFGGAHSPDNSRPGADPVRQAVAEDRRVDAAGARSNLLFVPAALVAILSLNDGAAGLVRGLVAGAAMALGAWLTREGLRAHAAWDARPIARRPAFPRKIAGGVMIGLGVGIAALANTPPWGAVLYGAVALALHLAAFGPDPLRDKRVGGVDEFQADRVARVVDEAEEYLAAMKQAVARLSDRALEGRVATFQALARQMIRQVETDPQGLAEAKKYLIVYLMGARDATLRFADVHARGRDPQARADYEALLTDLETNFAARTQRLLEGGREAMDIEIKVLRDRLAREGVRPQ
ncbi:MAG: 5-bromo-4-chloroindolyl phosphate hydrolysis family protein [Rubellimicrobium sp.]|nr:5-bromo-4-chloroindolyl phosphate hydrolysis family protein [Rubellimicrobium sp.]